MTELNRLETEWFKRQLERDSPDILTVQTEAEKSSVNGTQYEASFRDLNVAPRASVYISLAVGQRQAVISNIKIQFIGEALSYTLFRNPSGVLGSGTVPVYNMADGLAISPDVVVQSVANFSSIGTQVSPEILCLGDSSSRPRDIMSNLETASPVDRVLANNTEYLFRVTNESDIILKFAALASWRQDTL